MNRYRENKICPHCRVPLALDARVCFSCDEKVGKASRYGIAKTPVDYWSYVGAFLSWIGFYLYLRWAFF